MWDLEYECREEARLDAMYDAIAERELEQEWENMPYLISSLTLEQAIEWNNEVNKILYIEWKILDPENIPATDGWIAKIEERFEELLEEADIELK